MSGFALGALVVLAIAPAAFQRLGSPLGSPVGAPRACRVAPAQASLATSGWGRPLGNMEKLLDARRSWSGTLTTAHVSGSVLRGPAPTEAELLAALEWVVRRHPLLRAIVVGRGKHHLPDARPFALHDNYLKKAIEGKPELFKPEPDRDPPRFERSALAPAELARRALTVAVPKSDVETELVCQFRAALDQTGFDPTDDGPLWSLRLIPPVGGAETSALLWAADHAISDQLSHNQASGPNAHVRLTLHCALFAPWLSDVPRGPRCGASVHGPAEHAPRRELCLGFLPSEHTRGGACRLAALPPSSSLVAR